MNCLTQCAMLLLNAHIIFWKLIMINNGNIGRGSSDKERWNKVSGKTSRKDLLFQRQRMIAAIRGYLHAEDFLEAETPLLIKATCPDIHIDSVCAGGGKYLATSTEYQIKRMIAGGFDKVFTLTKNFRENDSGRYHSEEFTMLEWARAGKSLSDIEEDVIRFTRQAFSNLFPQHSAILFNGFEIDIMNAPWEFITVREAFRTYLGLDHLEDFSLSALTSASEKADILLPDEFKQSQYLVMSYLFDLLQKHLGCRTPTFLQEWPAWLTTSAPKSKKDPYAAERSELYIAGIEIADGFPFLRDPQFQRTLFAEELVKRKELGKPSVAIDERYIEALTDLPEGAGMALGIDRLAMVLTGAESLADVQPFSAEEL